MTLRSNTLSPRVLAILRVLEDEGVSQQEAIEVLALGIALCLEAGIAPGEVNEIAGSVQALCSEGL